MDADLLAALQPAGEMPAAVSKALERWREEAAAPPLFYTTDEVSRALHAPAPPMRRTLDALREAGHQATRTSFHPKGFRTDAGWREVLRALRPG